MAMIRHPYIVTVIPLPSVASSYPPSLDSSMAPPLAPQYPFSPPIFLLPFLSPSSSLFAHQRSSPLNLFAQHPCAPALLTPFPQPFPVVQYEDSFVEEGFLFVVMEFAGGGTMEKYTEPGTNCTALMSAYTTATGCPVFTTFLSATKLLRDARDRMVLTYTHGTTRQRFRETASSRCERSLRTDYHRRRVASLYRPMPYLILNEVKLLPDTCTRRVSCTAI